MSEPLRAIILHRLGSGACSGQAIHLAVIATVGHTDTDWSSTASAIEDMIRDGLVSEAGPKREIFYTRYSLAAKDPNALERLLVLARSHCKNVTYSGDFWRLDAMGPSARSTDESVRLLSADERKVGAQ